MAKEKEKEFNKQIPHSAEAEGYVLGSMMVAPHLAEEYCGRLRIDDFYLDVNQKVYAAILDLYKARKNIDYATVAERLRVLNTFEAVGGNNYLAELIDSVPSYIASGVYVDILLNKSLERELYYRSSKIANKVLDGSTELNDLLAESEKEILELVNKQQVSPIITVDKATIRVMELIEKNRNRAEGEVVGLDSGYDELNAFNDGFQPGQVIILAARPAVGKSTLALNIAQRMAQKVNAHVAFFSLEMSVEELVMRLLSTMSNVPLKKIRTGKMSDDEMGRLLYGKMAVDSLNIYLDETTTKDLENIKLQCRKLKREGHLDAIIIDYLQLLSLNSNGKSKLPRHEEVSTISRSIKLLARELEVPIIALSQLSRSVEKRGTDEKNNNKEPMLSDLRESGGIEQDADMVIFLHREGANIEAANKTVRSQKTKVIIAKNRQGATGDFELILRGECSSFESKKKEDK